jgi:hypothetical protein
LNEWEGSSADWRANRRVKRVAAGGRRLRLGLRIGPWILIISGNVVGASTRLPRWFSNRSGMDRDLNPEPPSSAAAKAAMGLCQETTLGCPDS